MKKMLFMTVDLGTSFIKAGVYDEAGQCHAKTQRTIESDSSMPGVFLQSGEKIFQSVLHCIKSVTELLSYESELVEAIGFTGQMAGFIGVDEQWEDITSWSCSLDTRYAPYVAKQMASMSEDFLEISGTNAPLMAPKCEWFVTEYSSQAERVAKYMLISSYIIGRLGRPKIEDAAIGDSYITWTGLADIKTGKWSESLCRKAGISVKLLPEIVKSDQVCGYLDAKVAEKVGLRSGLPLVAGAGDKIAGCIGSNVLSQGDMIFEASSYGAVSCLVKEYRPNRKRKDYDAIPALNQGEFYAHRYLPGSGVTLKWFLDTFNDGRQARGNNFLQIEKEAQKIPCGSEGLMAVGLLGGSAMPFDGDLKGAWLGYSWCHKKEHFYKALLESFGYELALTIDSLKEMYPEYRNVNCLKMIGGGAKSTLWPQVLADITGCDFVRLNRDDVALWGTALLTGYGIGAVKNIQEAAEKTVQLMNYVRPNKDNHTCYQNHKNIYENILVNVHDACVQINKIKI